MVKVLASHDQELTDEELMQLQEERTPIDIEHNSEWPKSEVIQELNVKHMRFLLWWTVLQWLQKSMALILKGHVGLGAGLQNVLNAYK